MAGKPRKKKLILTVTALVLTAALGAGIWILTRGSGDPVNVYAFQNIGMTEFWGDSQESYGPVSADKIQTAFLSDTQTVTEVAVKDGDTVKKGDVLFSFDTSLDALSLERKRLEVEKIKVQIKAAEERLAEVRNLEPNVPSEKPETETEEDLGKELKDKLYQISKNTVYDGSTQETALICWLRDDTPVSDAILRALYEVSLEYREKNAEEDTEEEDDEDKKGSCASAIPDSQNEEDPSNSSGTQSEKTGTVTLKHTFTGKDTGYEETTVTVGRNGYLIVDAISYRGTQTYWLKEARRLRDGVLLTGEELQIPAYPQEAGEARNQWEYHWGAGVSLVFTRAVDFTGKLVQDDQLTAFPEEEPIQLKAGEEAVLLITSQIQDLDKKTELTWSVSPADGIFKTSTDGNYLFLMGKPEEVTTSPVEYTVTARYTFDDNEDTQRAVEESFPFSVSVVSQTQQGEFYVVFKVTKDNYQKAACTQWRGYKVTAYENGTFEMLPFDASGFADHTLPPAEDVEIDLPEVIPGEMYTEEDILEMEKQLYITIREQVEKQKLAESEYEIMARELGDGNVYAEIDGKVVSVLTEEEARTQKQPLLKVSGGGGFFIEGSVSEFQKETLKLGQEVTVNDWNTGNTYTGEVVSIGDFPLDGDNWNGIGNPTASYYPFKAFVGEDADLRAGTHVSMTYSASSAENGFYLEKAFVRTEKGESYIFVRDDNGKLEKRMVKVGKVLWGSYYEILSELDADDYLAFPYGKNVKDGAPTVESDVSILYGY